MLMPARCHAAIIYYDDVAFRHAFACLLLLRHTINNVAITRRYAEMSAQRHCLVLFIYAIFSFTVIACFATLRGCY